MNAPCRWPDETPWLHEHSRRAALVRQSGAASQGASGETDAQLAHRIDLAAAAWRGADWSGCWPTCWRRQGSAPVTATQSLRLST